MEDFDALAAALGAGIADLRGCLILSRDGLVLGGHPDTAEQELKASWLRFAALGEPERGFVQFGNEIWSYTRKGPYGSFAVTGLGVRPGIVIDHIERVLLAAEETRAKREGPAVATASAPPAQASETSSGPAGRKKRRPHRDPSLEAPVVIHVEPVATYAEPATTDVASETWQTPSDDGEGPFGEVEETEPDSRPSPGRSEEPADDEPAVGPEGSDEGDEVDRFSLAAEFSRLLQDKRDDADG